MYENQEDIMEELEEIEKIEGEIEGYESKFTSEGGIYSLLCC